MLCFETCWGANVQSAKESASEEQKRLLEGMTHNVKQQAFFMKRAMVRIVAKAQSRIVASDNPWPLSCRTTKT